MCLLLVRAKANENSNVNTTMQATYENGNFKNEIDSVEEIDNVTHVEYTGDYQDVTISRVTERLASSLIDGLADGGGKETTTQDPEDVIFDIGNGIKEKLANIANVHYSYDYKDDTTTKAPKSIIRFIIDGFENVITVLQKHRSARQRHFRMLESQEKEE